MAASAPLRRLGAELRRLREAAGRTQMDVAEAIGRTHTTLANWELGKTKIAKGALALLLAELRAPLEVRKGLEQLREEAGRGGSQWATYGLPSWLRPFVSFEEDAAKECDFQPIVIPGLLQTEDYARATHLAASHVVPPGDVERWVAARMRRRERLTGPDPLRLHAVIGEAALRLAVIGPEGMAAQLKLLVDMAERDNVTVQVLPGAKGMQAAGVANNFMVLHFADSAADPPLALHDGPLGGYVIHDEGDVAALDTLFSDLAAAALNETDSTALITAIMREFANERSNDHA